MHYSTNAPRKKRVLRSRRVQAHPDPFNDNHTFVPLYTYFVPISVNLEGSALYGAEINTFYFKDDGSIPNNPSLPVLVYRGVLRDDPAQAERIFNQNGWLNSWTNGVFGYHHYHSITHEVLGVAGGTAILQLGGENGRRVELRAGDVVVLPAGTGHQKISSSPDFSVVGAYPDGMDYNMCTGKPDERPRVLEEIRHVPLPRTDPLFGASGPLKDAWKPVKEGW